MTSQLLNRYRRLLTLAEAGLFYGKDEFDKERYQELKEISLELLANISAEPLEELEKLFDKSEGYPTPKIDVRAFIKHKDKILLVEDTNTKEWSLPGGYAEVGFSPKENIIKEVFEETGMSVTVDKLLAVFDTDLREDIPQLFQYYKLIFGCTIVSGSFQNNLETSNLGFFNFHELPKLSKQRTTKEQLIMLNKRSTTYFD
ncbi:NUDIX hydrolase N-terminal domain-containing protein [Paenibacillus sp. SYP-B4298]|uniref:NUDIX hydrolase N-terminal domain-containing protein n=1 Tax=Paenibacillus sp. SYP-B4298 TaxID=2996034 RepID=UPI0022DDA608|nr:NUDIX hydrolase [Paenibacillus sp. SYP-B4298]